MLPAVDYFATPHPPPAYDDASADVYDYAIVCCVAFDGEIGYTGVVLQNGTIYDAHYIAATALCHATADAVASIFSHAFDATRR